MPPRVLTVLCILLINFFYEGLVRFHRKGGTTPYTGVLAPKIVGQKTKSKFVDYSTNGDLEYGASFFASIPANQCKPV